VKLARLGPEFYFVSPHSRAGRNLNALCDSIRIPS